MDEDYEINFFDEKSKKPNTPAGYYFLTNTRHKTLEEYLEEPCSDLTREIFQTGDLLMLDEAYDTFGNKLPNYKAIFKKFI